MSLWLFKKNCVPYMIGLALLWGMTGCNVFKSSGPTATITPVPSTPTPVVPTDTPAPMAAAVDGAGIQLADYQGELQRYQSAQSAAGKTVDAAAAAKTVMDDLVDQQLLANAAFKAGFQLDDAKLQAHIDDLTKQLGDPSKLAAWEKQNGYTDDSFRRLESLALAAAWQRDQIINAVPQTAAQVHARQILVFTSAEADSIESQVKTGADFATLASNYDPDTGGDLGWFPKGYLTETAIESAAFSMQAGQVSDVIKTDLGYHIIQVIAIDPKHPLSPDVRLTLQHKALEQWLQDQRSKSTIKILTP
ncbi:MAG: peptidylprolyl isomerase [Anaerolineaceae bacterium]|nr:peptidylprolyl isomerase [Anaerolineaceae bacterium]